MMDLEEARSALETFVGAEVHVSVTERQADGLTSTATETPFVGELSRDESDFIVGQEDDPSQWRFTLAADSFESAEWTDDPEPHTLHVALENDRITISRAT